MDTLLVECPIHLDAVPINDIRVFRCGHGFCEPCLTAHITRNANPLTCPSCRKQVKRKEAFQLFLTPARLSSQLPGPSSGSGSSESSPDRQRAADQIYRHLTLELEQLRAVQVRSSTRVRDLEDEVVVLSNHNDHHTQTIQVLRDQKEELQRRLQKEVESFRYVTEENDKLKEELMTLRVENQRAVRAADQARQDSERAHQRVKDFQGYIEKYKRKIELSRNKRKALQRANKHSPKKVEEVEDESLMVVDTNAPDTLHQDDPGLGWLDEACEVKGDMLDVTDGEDEDEEKDSEDELPLRQRGWIDKRPPMKEDRAPKPFARFSSDWTLGSDLGKKRRPDDSRVGGSKLSKVKMAGDSVLRIDRHGHVPRTTVLGSRQKLNSKN